MGIAPKLIGLTGFGFKVQGYLYFNSGINHHFSNPKFNIRYPKFSSSIITHSYLSEGTLWR